MKTETQRRERVWDVLPCDVRTVGFAFGGTLVFLASSFAVLLICIVCVYV